MQDHERYNDRLFSRWAPVYDGFEVVLGNIRKQVAHEINPTRATILDVATGTGSMAMALSTTATEVVGIDLSSAQKWLKDRVSRMHCQRIIVVLLETDRLMGQWRSC